MDNLSILNTDEKIVQMCDVINLMDARIKELEADLCRLKDDNHTIAMGDVGDVGNLDDFKGLDLPPIDLDAHEVKEVKKAAVKEAAVKKAAVKKVKNAKLSNEDMAQLSQLPYDPMRCRRRLWNGGYGCQCGKDVYENGLCEVDYNKLYHDTKKKDAWAEKETFPEGYYDEDKSSLDLITGKWKGWKGIDKPKKASKKAPKKPSKKVLNVLPEAPQEVVIQPPEAPQEVVIQPPDEGIGYDLEEELGDELDEYDDFEYQGVMYQVKNDILYTVNWEEIGTVEGRVAIFKDEGARQAHDEHPDKDDE